MCKLLTILVTTILTASFLLLALASRLILGTPSIELELEAIVGLFCQGESREIVGVVGANEIITEGEALSKEEVFSICGRNPLKGNKFFVFWCICCFSFSSSSSISWSSFKARKIDCSIKYNEKKRSNQPTSKGDSITPFTPSPFASTLSSSALSEVISWSSCSLHFCFSSLTLLW